MANSGKKRKKITGKRAHVSVNGVDLGEVVKWEAMESQPAQADFHQVAEEFRQVVIQSMAVSSEFFSGLSSAFARTAVAIADMATSMSDATRAIMLEYFKSVECLNVTRPEPRDWPANVVQLATALQAGEDCHFALHDAFLDAGAPEPAEHFREKRIHHPDCCVLKGILGQADSVGLDVTSAETPPGMRGLILGDTNAPRPQGIIDVSGRH